MNRGGPRPRARGRKPRRWWFDVNAARTKNPPGFARLLRWLGVVTALVGCLPTTTLRPTKLLPEAAVSLSLNGRDFCSGVRIGPYTILTAEHCLATAEDAGAVDIGVGDDACRPVARDPDRDLGWLECRKPGPYMRVGGLDDVRDSAGFKTPAAGALTSKRGWKPVSVTWAASKAWPAPTYDLRRLRVDVQGGCWPGESGSAVVVEGRVVGVLILAGAVNSCTAVAVGPRPAPSVAPGLDAVSTAW